MTVLAGAKLRNRVIVIVLIFLQNLLSCRPIVASNNEVFFDRYGDCERTQPFDLSDDDYKLKHLGGGFFHESLICGVTFKAPPNSGVCLTFEEFEIVDCTMRINIYNSLNRSQKAWRVLDCTNSKPGQMCTSSRYVTVVVIKEKLNHNKGYNFKIDVRKSSSITEEGVFFASIGVFVGVILGVVALTAVLAISVIYCCCKHKNRSGTKKKTVETNQAGSHENRNLVQPSAPPVDIEDQHWVGDHEGNFYTHFSPYPPPPYAPPPPYQTEDTEQEQGPRNDQSQSYPVKP